MNKQQIIDAAIEIATNMGTDPHASPIADVDMAAEDLLPLAFRHVYVEMLRVNPGRKQDLLKDHSIGLTDGEGVFPTDIISEYTDDGFLPEFPYSSYVVNYPDFKRQKFNNLLCYWTERAGVFYTTCTTLTSSEEGDSGSGSEEVDETIVLTAPTFPTLPANATDQVVVDARDLEEIINTLARALRGEIKLAIS